jgi:hypothetical protein
MCGNRVEELESRVKELEASVEGLTDELVECKVRLRELENAVDDDLGFVPEDGAGASDDEIEAAVDESPDAAEASNTEAPDGEEKESESDIIVA